MNFGIIPDEDIDVYHKTDAISSTKVKFFGENFPVHYWHKYIAKDCTPEPKKDHYEFGHALEARLGGEEFYRNVVAVSKFPNWRTDEAKQWRKKQWDEGWVVIDKDDDKLVTRCYDAVMANPDARAIVEAAEPQVTFREKLNSVAVQCRSDLWLKEGITLPSDGLFTGMADCDIKTIDNLTPGAFTSFDKQVAELDYANAAVFYRYVIRLTLAKAAGVQETSIEFPRRLFIVVDKQEWPSCIVYQLPQALIEAAENDLIGTTEKRGLLPQLIEHYRTNNWPGAPVRKMIEPGRDVKWRYPELFP